LINEKSIEANLQGTFKILKSLGELAKQNQTEFLLHLVPAKFVYEKNSPYSAYSDKIFQKSVQLAKDHSLEYFTAYEELKQGGDKNYYDFCHPNLSGSKIISDALTGRVIRRYQP